MGGQGIIDFNFGKLGSPSPTRRGRWLEYFTIVYNSLEGIIAIIAGLFTGSIALVGFGFDSLIEVTSGAALLWRLHQDVDEERRERIRKLSPDWSDAKVVNVSSCD